MFTKIGQIVEYEIFEERDEKSRVYWLRKKEYGYMMYVVGIPKEEKIDILSYILKCNFIGMYEEDLEKLEN